MTNANTPPPNKFMFEIFLIYNLFNSTYMNNYYSDDIKLGIYGMDWSYMIDEVASHNTDVL